MPTAHILVGFNFSKASEVDQIMENLRKIPNLIAQRLTASKWDALLTAKTDDADSLRELIYKRDGGIRWMEGINGASIEVLYTA